MLRRLLSVLLCFVPLGADAAWHSVLQVSVGLAPTTYLLTSTIPSGWTFTRASSATYCNSSNLIATATTNTARFNTGTSFSNCGTGSGTYLLYEPAATNLALQSNAFQTTPWASTGGTGSSTAAALTSPDGTTDGWAFNVTGGSFFFGYGQTIAYSAATYTASVWAGVDNSANISLQIQGTSNNLTPTASWVRYSLAVATSGSQFAGVAVNGFGTTGIFGMQVELGSAPTSYIPTTTATVTRATDSLTIPAGQTTGYNFATVTFSDATTQKLSITGGSSYTFTAPLNESLLTSVTLSVS